MLADLAKAHLRADFDLRVRVSDYKTAALPIELRRRCLRRLAQGWISAGNGTRVHRPELKTAGAGTRASQRHQGRRAPSTAVLTASCRSTSRGARLCAHSPAITTAMAPAPTSGLVCQRRRQVSSPSRKEAMEIRESGAGALDRLRRSARPR